MDLMLEMRVPLATRMIVIGNCRHAYCCYASAFWTWRFSYSILMFG